MTEVPMRDVYGDEGDDVLRHEDLDDAIESALEGYFGDDDLPETVCIVGGDFVIDSTGNTVEIDNGVYELKNIVEFNVNVHEWRNGEIEETRDM